MSAEDGIYILRTKDEQCRIVWEQNIKKIFNSWERFDELETVYVWRNCRYTKDFKKALSIAKDFDISRCTEYGVKVYEIPLTWKHLVERAKNQARYKLKNSLILDDYMKLKCNEIINL